ncbi:MAG: crotonase/enoyl-CoA hydratase family protein [Proteobacteria bacterium]|nr:crotonase/enoyl-CoA hydratase family protein [Pseudomonadota bacterium]
MSDASPLKVEKDGHIAWLVLNRPEKRNTMDQVFFQAMIDQFDELDHDPEVRVVVIRGEGKSFSAGLDLASAGNLTASQAADYRETLRREIVRLQYSMTCIEKSAKPVIAAVHSHCIGGGVDLCCACDIRIASRDAIFSVREARIAIVADLGTLQRLPAIVGESWARELALTGRDFSAEQAKDMGFLTHICDDREALYKKAGELAREIADLSPLAVQGVKDTMRFSKENGVQAGLEYVAQKNAAIIMCEDVVEAFSAFLEKRKPDFKGR